MCLPTPSTRFAAATILGRWLASLCLLLALGLPANCLGQAVPAWRLVAALPVGAPYASALATDAQGNIYVGGAFYDTLQLGPLQLRSLGGRDGFVAKWNIATASFEWARQLGGPADEQVTAIATEQGLVYIAGRFNSSAVSLGHLTLAYRGMTGNDNAFVAKLRDTGPGSDFDWAQTLGSNQSSATALAVQNGSVYVGGTFYGPATFGSTLLPDCHQDANGFVAKLTDAGASARCEWGQPVGVGVRALAVGPAGIYATGHYSGTVAEFGGLSLPSHGSFNMYVAKLRDAGALGTTEWVQHAGGIEFGWVSGLAVSGTSVYIGGSFFGKTQLFGTTELANANHGHGTDIFLAKLTDAGTTGNFTWAQRAGGLGHDEVMGVAANETGVYLLGEYSSSGASFGPCQVPNVWGADIVVAHLQDAGNTAAFTWAQSIGSAANDAGFGLAVSGPHIYTSGFLAAPARVGQSAPMRGAFIGELLATAGSTSASALSNNWLVDIYPNPGTELVTIRLPPLPSVSAAQLTLFNAQGQAIRRLTLPLTASFTQQELNVSDLAKGVYVLRVQAGNTWATGRLLVR